MFNNIVVFVRKYILVILMFLIAIAIILPFIINTCLCRKITADGLITYVASIFATIITLFTAVVAIYNSDKAQEANDINRRMIVAPDLFIKINVKNDEYEINVMNDSDYSARLIYLYDIPLITYIKGKGESRKKFTISKESNSSGIYIPKENFVMLKKNIIQEFELLYQDIDGRIIQQKFSRNDVDEYISDEQIYL